MGEQEPSLVPATFGRFVAGAELGRGATGVVMRARDPELDRDVAIKVLHDGGGEDLRREAQAMARLSHPNVVAVYESGQAGDRRFIAMELVEGTTLAAWLAAAPRTWREVVAAFVAAGRGLAAAHAAGVVHRDFKPDNVLVGHDGRPRVTDFGVSISGLAPDAVVDARTDQHAFCAALAKALQPTPGAPASIRAAFERGLEGEPAARWPSMDALLTALEPPPVRRRWPWIAGVAAAAAALIAAALVVGRWAPAASEVCPDPARRLAGLWDPTVKARLRLAFAIASPFRAGEATTRVERVFDPYARRWRLAHREVCRATHVLHAQPPAELDRRMACLDQRRDALGNLTALLAGADRELVGRAGEAAGALPDVDACLDPRVMQAPALPVDLEARHQLAALDAQLGALTTRAYQAKPADQLAATTAALAEARRLGYLPALVRALRLQQRALNAAAAAGAEIAAVVEELAQRAAETHDDTVSAVAWIDLFSLRSGDTGDPAAEALLPVAEAAVNRAGATPALRYSLANARAVHLARGKHVDAALEMFGTAHDLADTDERRADVQLNITKLTFMTRGGAAAMPEATKLVPACQAGYGANSPSTAACHQLLAQVLMASGDDDQAEPHLREALRIRSSVLAPDHPDVAASLHTLGNLAAGRGDLETARRVLQRALDIYDRRGDRAAAGRTRGLLGSYVAWIDYPRARQMILRGFDDLAATKGPDSREHLEAELNFALLLASDKYCAEALSYLIAAAPRLEKVQPRGLPLLLWTWADCEAVAFGNERGALVRLERAYALCETGTCDPPMLETVMFRMGRIHFEVLGHQARGRALVDEAATLARDHDAGRLVDEIARWQVKHPRR